METQIAIKTCDELLRKFDRMQKFASKYGVHPYDEARKIASGLEALASELPSIQTPSTDEELILSELKRKAGGEAQRLAQWLGGRHYDFEIITSLYNIPQEDLDALKPWLKTNKEETLASIERLFAANDSHNYELGLPLDIPSVRRQAEGLAEIYIQKYHQRIGTLLQKLTKTGEFLRDINAVATHEKRSYFSTLIKTLALGIPAFCYMTEDGGIHVLERELIRLFGHEGMGHALHQLITNTSELPFFLKHFSRLTEATAESIAQFYERRLLEDLKQFPAVQKELGIQHIFSEIYQDAQDIRKINDYFARLNQYAIIVLADKELGHPNSEAAIKKRIELLSELALHPSYALETVEGNRYKYDSQGNLFFDIVSELRYCAQPVQRALKEFEKRGIKYEGKDRSLIDATLYHGYWTPKGYVDRARLVAEKATENRDSSNGNSNGTNGSLILRI